MAIAQVNGTTATSGATSGTSQAITYSPTAGNFVFIVLATGGTISAPSVVDNNSHALTLFTFAAGRGFIFTGIAQAGATSYTASWTTSAKSSLLIEEYSGTTTTGATASNNGNSTAPTVTTVTTAVNSWVVAGTFSVTNSTYTAATGNLRQSTNGGAGNGNSGAINDNSGTSIGSSVVNAETLSGSITWATGAVELIPTGTTVNNSLAMMGAGT